MGRLTEVCRRRLLFISFLALVGIDVPEAAAGQLLKFDGDVVLLVLIRGSNLDATTVGGVNVNLTDRGLQWHRIVRMREIEENDLWRAEKGEPTVDRIDVATFDSQEKLREWASLPFSAFCREFACFAHLDPLD